MVHKVQVPINLFSLKTYNITWGQKNYIQKYKNSRIYKREKEIKKHNDIFYHHVLHHRGQSTPAEDLHVSLVRMDSSRENCLGRRSHISLIPVSPFSLNSALKLMNTVWYTTESPQVNTESIMSKWYLYLNLTTVIHINYLDHLYFTGLNLFNLFSFFLDGQPVHWNTESNTKFYILKNYKTLPVYT